MYHLIRYLIIFIAFYAVESFGECKNTSEQYYLKSDNCTQSETDLFASQTENMKSIDYCGFTNPCSDKTREKVEIKNNDELLSEMIEQKIGELFDEIASSNKDLDEELANGNLKSCSLNQIDSFPESCKQKLNKHKITSKKFQDAFSSSVVGGKFNPKCMSGADSLYLLAESEEKTWMRTISNDKGMLDVLLKSKSDEAMIALLNKKYSGMMAKNNIRLNVIFNSRQSLKSYIDNNSSLSAFNKKEWARSLEDRCSSLFKSLENFLCGKLPEGAFAISDYKYVQHFNADTNEEFNKDYCAKDKQQLELSEPFTKEAIYSMSPTRKSDMVRADKDINKVICPLKTKCEDDSNPINCLKNECTIYASATKDQLKKNVVGQQQKKYCEDLFDFKNGGSIKNPELVNFLAEKKDRPSLNGLPVPNVESKLMGYFLTPSANDNKEAKVAGTEVKSNHGNTAGVQQGNSAAAASSANYNVGSFQNANTPTNNGSSSVSNTKNKNTAKRASPSEEVDITNYEKVIEAQDQLQERLDRAKNSKFIDNSKTNNSNTGTRSGNAISSTNSAPAANSEISNTGDFGNNSNNIVNGAANNTEDKQKSKNQERSVSGNNVSTKDNTKVNSFSASNLDNTSLEHKNNIASSMDVDKDGQFKVTLKNLDPKTLNMELFKDEIKKQAKEAMDKGIPFVISIVNNDKEITINMIPKEKDGIIMYIPNPKEENPESLAFAEKLKNSFQASSKVVIKKKNARVSVSDFEN